MSIAVRKIRENKNEPAKMQTRFEKLIKFVIS